MHLFSYGDGWGGECDDIGAVRSNYANGHGNMKSLYAFLYCAYLAHMSCLGHTLPDQILKGI